MDYANAQQRASLLEEFYGPEFALFKVSPLFSYFKPLWCSFSKIGKADEKRTLDTILVSQTAEKKDSIMKHIKDAITPLLEKGRTSHHIIHRLILDYLTHAPETAAGELMESIREQAVEMCALSNFLHYGIPLVAGWQSNNRLHTREGAQVALQCVWKSDAKGRKALLKTFKPYAPKVQRHP